MENKQEILDDIEMAMAMRGYRILCHDTDGNPVFRNPDDCDAQFVVMVNEYYD